MGWDILDVLPAIELFETTMIGGFGANFGEFHNLITNDNEVFWKSVNIPIIEQCHV